MSRDARAWRRTKPSAVAVGVCLSLALAGCHVIPYTQKHPRSVSELYQEAVAARAKYPEYTELHGQSSIPTAVPEVIFPDASETELPLEIEHAPPAHEAKRSVKRDRAIVLASATQSETYAGVPRVTEIFEETEVRQAIQALAAQAGLSVVVDDRVAGVTSAHIENEPFDLALKKLLLPLGFVFKKKEGQYLIGVADPLSAMFSQISETIEFRPLHLGPTELLPLLPESLKKFVQVVEKRNIILIEAPDEVARRIVSRLEQSDRPVPQVVLEAMVCVLNPTKNFQYNFDARQSLTVDGKDLMNIGLTGLAGSGSVTPKGLDGAFSDFALTSTFLKLLAQEGYVTIRAAPRVMAKDGEKATISIARETFFSIQPSNAGIVFQSSIQQVEAGITLDIIPVVRGNTVTVNIEKAEVSEPIRQQDQSDQPNTRFPLINRRKVSTTVHVQDGQTIVIGGLVQRQTIDRVSRIPGIGDIPWFGRLFQYIDQEDAEAEVVIFIAPRIVQPAGCETIAHESLPLNANGLTSPIGPLTIPAGPELAVPPKRLKPDGDSSQSNGAAPPAQPGNDSRSTKPAAVPSSPRGTPRSTPTPTTPNPKGDQPEAGNAPNEIRFLAPTVITSPEANAEPAKRGR